MFSRFAHLARAARSAAAAASGPAAAASSSTTLLAQSTAGAGSNGSSRGFAVMGMTSGLLLGLGGIAHADEAEHGLHAARYLWPHEGAFDSYDHSSIRRGHQVYQQVCAACHSMNLIAYRNLVGVAYTEDEVKLLAEEVEVRVQGGCGAAPPHRARQRLGYSIGLLWRYSIGQPRVPPQTPTVEHS